MCSTLSCPLLLLLAVSFEFPVKQLILLRRLEWPQNQATSVKGLKRRSRFLFLHGKHTTVTENLTVTDRVGACRVSCMASRLACSVGVADEDLTGGKAALVPVPACQVTSLPSRMPLPCKCSGVQQERPKETPRRAPQADPWSIRKLPLLCSCVAVRLYCLPPAPHNGNCKLGAMAMAPPTSQTNLTSLSLSL